jgi:hypothetical protein
MKALRLTAKMQDAVLEFLESCGKNEESIVAAGECLILGMRLLVESLFGYDVAFEEKAIWIQKDKHHNSRWRVNFAWKLDGEEE